MKNIVSKSVQIDAVYGYCPTKGLEKTREYIASKTPKITKNDIIFFNGL